MRVAHYEILEELGRGGMGIVYSARDMTLGRTVALKCPLPAGDASDPGQCQRLLREARAASSISHPHIVPIYEVLEHDGVPWLAMELVDGCTLRGLLAAGRPLPSREILRYAEGLASALAAAHARGLLHRDVKPGNVMVTSDGRAVLTDFGLARTFEIDEESTTRSRDAEGEIVGTLRYMSPEQALGKELDARSDIFSFGTVLYEMCAGVPAFPESGRQALDAVLHRPPLAISRLNYDAPGELERIVRKCLAKDPEDRYQSARDLTVDLRALRQQLEHAEYGRSLPAPPPRKRSRRAMVAVLTLSSAAAVLALLARVVSTRWPFSTAAPSARAERTLAFVPLEIATRDPAWENLVDGLTDDLMRELQQAGVAVRSRETVSQLRGLTDPQISRRFGVNTIGRGKISLAGIDLVLEAWLADAATGVEFWRRTYRQPLDHLGALYVAVAGDIASATGDATPHAASGNAQARVIDAYKAYYRGRFYWRQRDRKALFTSIDYFKIATELDPTYAQAWAGMADAYLSLGVPTFGALHPSEARRLAKEAALKGVAAGPSVAEIQASLAHVSYAYDWDWKEAERRYQAAIRLNPQYATSHHWYCDYLTAMGRPDEAMREVRTALTLEPGSAAIQRDLAWTPFFLGHYEEAVASLTRTLTVNPGFMPARTLLGRALTEAGRTGDGLAEMMRIAPELPGPAADSSIAYAEAADGQRAQAEATLQKAIRAGEKPSPGTDAPYASPYLISLVLTRLGRYPAALDWLEKGFEDHDPLMTTLMVDPRLAALHGEARFKALIRKMNFPDREAVSRH